MTMVFVCRAGTEAPRITFFVVVLVFVEVKEPSKPTAEVYYADVATVLKVQLLALQPTIVLDSIAINSK